MLCFRKSSQKAFCLIYLLWAAFLLHLIPYEPKWHIETAKFPLADCRCDRGGVAFHRLSRRFAGLAPLLP
jgi:hypothetical protein